MKRLQMAPLMAVALITQLQTHVQTLATSIGGRVATPGLDKAAVYIEQELRSYGYSPQRQEFVSDGHTFANIEAQTPGVQTPNRILVIGAHYDTAGDIPGANDNASGVAATLELARQFVNTKPAQTIRWLFFVNEEPPYLQTPGMGSYVYAKRCRERNENISAMLALETMGFYTNERRTQSYPIGLKPFPDRGNFLAFIANVDSGALLRSAVKSFRAATALPAEAVTAPASITGVSWSDHWSFWQFGYPAVMVTDTAPFRYPYYHTAQDTPDKLDYPHFTEAVQGIAAVVDSLSK